MKNNMKTLRVKTVTHIGNQVRIVEFTNKRGATRRGWMFQETMDNPASLAAWKAYNGATEITAITK